MFGWLKRLFAKSQPQSTRVVRLRARYDAAVTTENHWRNVDAMSAKAANDLETRRKLRERSRYETANNCHARGITLTMANDLIGTGPRLQVGYEDDAINEAIETAWHKWATEICLDEKLHTMALSKTVDGEAFAVFVTNPDLYDSVKLDIKPIECDQVSTPAGVVANPFIPNWVDGIVFDERGNPQTYHVMRQHPGDPIVMNWDYDEIPARNMLHWFRCDRPGQLRGIPEITPALPLFSQLRRYTLAVIEAAECAADFAVVLATDSMPDADSMPAGQSSYLDPFDSTEIDKGMMVTGPAGYKPYQMKPEQPTATHDAFCKTILKEIFHCLNMPYAVGSGDFADDSYSSGRLGKQTYMRSIKVQRHPLHYKILDRVFTAWLNEAVMIEGYFGDVRLPATDARDIPHQWHFRDEPYVDPLKDAQADEQDLANCTSTLAEKCAERGLDYRDVIKQQGKEKKLRQEAGIYVDPNPVPVTTANEPAGAAA